MTRRRTASVAAMAVGALLVAATPVEATSPIGASYAGFDATYGDAGTAPKVGGQFALDDDGRVLSIDVSADPDRLVRLDPTGAVDAGYAPALAATTSGASLQVVQGDVASVTDLGSDTRRIQRFDGSGAPLAAFGTEGVLTLGTPSQVLQQDDGSVYVARNGWGSFVVERYDATGALDPAFGDDGSVLVECCTDEALTVTALVVEDSGSVAVAARTAGGSAVVRIASDGASSVVTGLSPLPLTSPLSLHPEEGGGLLVRLRATPTSGAIGLGRLEPDLSVDGTFGTDGVLEESTVPLRAGPRMLVAFGLFGTTTIRAIGPDGYDPSFGGDGEVSSRVNGSVGLESTVKPAFAVGLADGGFLIAQTLVRSAFTGGTSVTVEQFDAHQERVLKTSKAGDFAGALVGQDEDHLVTFSTEGPIFGPGDRGVDGTHRFVVGDPRQVPGPVRDLTGVVRATSEGVRLKAEWLPPLPTDRGLAVLDHHMVITRLDVAEVVYDGRNWSSASSHLLADPSGAYRLDLRAVSLAGAGPSVAEPVIVVPPFASAEAFTTQLAADIGGRDPLAGEVAGVTEALLDGAAPSFLVRAALDDPAWAGRLDPVARLYRAYFGRLPDHGGLRYWMGRRAAGVSVARISAVFADSSEFRSTYGSLTNRQFVELVYRNVLGRDGDPAGIAFWTGRLDRRVTSRGHLMASFSESSEHVRTTAAEVATVSAFEGLLARVPSAGELDDWTGDDPIGDEDALVRQLVASGEYAARVNAG